MPNPQTPANPPVALTRRDLEARIIAKAWKDPNYRKRLLADPKGVLQQEIGAIDPSVSLPAALQVQVHEEAPDTYHLVLPRNPKDISLGEILGDNLEAVAPQTVAVVANVVQNVMGIQVVNAAVVQAVTGIQVVNTVALNMTTVVAQVNVAANVTAVA
jgi:hypothetical protein